MLRRFALLLLPFILFVDAGCVWRRKGPPPAAPAKDYAKPLPPGASALVEVDSAQLPTLTLTPASRAEFRAALARSLAYLAHPSGDRGYPVSGITKTQVEASLRALDDLVARATSDAAFNSELRQRFRAYQSIGCDGNGTVLFTGYYTPIFEASMTPDATFRYPLYRKPTDLTPGVGDDIAQQTLPNGSKRPYPSRQELETSGALRGLELAYFSDPFEAYVVQVQGSGKLRLRDGRIQEVGFAATNNHRYPAGGIAKELIADGKITANEVSLTTLRRYFKQHPEDLPHYTAHNPRFIFFTEVHDGPFGSLNQKVTTNVTVAADKSIFPAGAACLVQTQVYTGGARSDYAALRLDQDAGGGIRAPGRCDLYMGEGESAEQRAGLQLAEGKLFYLIVR